MPEATRGRSSVFEPIDVREGPPTPSPAPSSAQALGTSPTPTRVPTDRDLLAGCRSGDANAWSTLVARYERLVFTTALRQGIGREDAADVTQTAFVALLEGIAVLREHESLPYWLMTVARRQAWRLSRRTAREVAVPSPRVAPTEPVEWEEMASLHEALNQLNPRCRDLLMALYFDASEPTYAEVARRMDRPVGGIGPMRGRCLEHLRELLAERETP